MQETLVQGNSLHWIEHMDLVQEVSKLWHFSQLILWKLTSAWKKKIMEYHDGTKLDTSTESDAGLKWRKAPFTKCEFLFLEVSNFQKD